MFRSAVVSMVEKVEKTEARKEGSRDVLQSGGRLYGGIVLVGVSNLRSTEKMRENTPKRVPSVLRVS